MKTLVLSANDLKACVDPDDLRARMRMALTDFAMNKTQNFPRQVVETGPSIALGFMPARSGSLVGYKAVALAPRNRKRGLNPHQGAVTLLDGETGEIRAIMDGSTLTALRTAAVSAAATEALARTDAKVLGILGAGRQAREHILALTRTRPIRKIVLWARDEGPGRRLIEELSDFPIELRPSPLEVARLADILVTCTASTEYLLTSDHLRPGSHVNAIGACRPGMREIQLMDRPGLGIYLDSSSACELEASEVKEPLNHGKLSRSLIRAEIGQVFASNEPGRRTNAEVTVFKSVGLGVEDLYAAAYAVERAATMRLGRTFSLSGGV
ncbi:MAG: ornithine cyclodeaminase family protein [Oligoflexia bacterium]|nr:ornithine cyclodeaminase family protein [Oligoflexia bacterium]